MTSPAGWTARDALAQAGFDALLVTPGADLRYLTGYDALALERLTCLVLAATGAPALVVPALEELAAQGSPVSGLDIEVRPWQESADPVAVVTGVVGSASTMALDERMWAEKVLSSRAAMPHARQGSPRPGAAPAEDASERSRGPGPAQRR